MPIIAAQAQRPFAGPRRRLTDEEIDVLVLRHQNGARIIDLSQELGIDRSTVSKHLRRRGVESEYLKYCAWEPQQIEEAVLMYVDGATLHEIGVAVGRAPNTVRRRLLAEGVELRIRGRRPS
jgi:DNA-directed RNA polymerase specialized sigma24 family protein